MRGRSKKWARRHKRDLAPSETTNGSPEIKGDGEQHSVPTDLRERTPWIHSIGVFLLIIGFCLGIYIMLPIWLEWDGIRGQCALQIPLGRNHNHTHPKATPSVEECIQLNVLTWRLRCAWMSAGAATSLTFFFALHELQGCRRGAGVALFVLLLWLLPQSWANRDFLLRPPDGDTTFYQLMWVVLLLCNVAVFTTKNRCARVRTLLLLPFVYQEDDHEDCTCCE